MNCLIKSVLGVKQNYNKIMKYDMRVVFLFGSNGLLCECKGGRQNGYILL